MSYISTLANSGSKWRVPGGHDGRGSGPNQLHHVPHPLWRKTPGLPETKDFQTFSSFQGTDPEETIKNAFGCFDQENVGAIHEVRDVRRLMISWALLNIDLLSFDYYWFEWLILGWVEAASYVNGRQVHRWRSRRDVQGSTNKEWNVRLRWIHQVLDILSFTSRKLFHLTISGSLSMEPMKRSKTWDGAIN